MPVSHASSDVSAGCGVRGEAPHDLTPPRESPTAMGLKAGCGVKQESPRENRSTAGRGAGWNLAPYGGVGHPTPLPEGAAGSHWQVHLDASALELDASQKIAMLKADLTATRQRLAEAGASEAWERLLCAPVEALLEELAVEELLR